jgi:DNA modification methylase
VLQHIAPGSQDFLFSCPPYFDLETYSDLPNDASNQGSYEEFYEILETAFSNAANCLKDNRFAVVVVGDIRDKKTGGYYNFPGDVINTFRRKGFVLYNNIKLLTPIGTAAIRAARYMEYRKVAHVYQDVLVFYRGDQKQIKKEFANIKVANVSEDMEF